MKPSSLNHTYRLIWNASRQAWMVVSELTKSQGKSKAVKNILCIASMLAFPIPQMGYADVTGGVVTSGSGSIVQTGQVTTINQQSQTLHLNWNTFNIDHGQTVNFVQPSTTALAVNQILDTNGSRILGSLNANGIVWLINPNGVFFGQGAQVNVGSILAATLNPLSATGASEQVFGNGGIGSVINQGNITAANGGYVALIANSVSNQGNIVANNGTVALAGGSQVTLSFADNSLYKINVDQSTLNNLAENKKLIQANGGAVFLSAGAKQSLLASLVNNEGIIEAQSIEEKEGKIILLAGMAAGTTKVAGTLDASAQTGDGGFIETSGASVKVVDSANITTKSNNGNTGTWLIDPLDFKIAATDGNISGSEVSAALGSNNVKIQTADNNASCAGVVGCKTSVAGNGDIFVNDFISWSSDKTLTLSAYRNVYINRTITASNANGKLALEYGQGAVALNNTATYNISAKVNLRAGENFSTKLGSNGTTTQYSVITNLGSQASSNDGSLQGILGNLSGNYVLGSDIEAINTSGWNGGQGFKPLGNDGFFGNSNPFTGKFDGLGHVINDLFINRPDEVHIGLFGYAGTSALIQNVGLVNVNITGQARVGGLVGTNFGNISGSFVTGTVKGGYDVGGLLGLNGGLVKNTYFKGEVKAIDNLGGLVGVNAGYDGDTTDPSEGHIENSYADSTITMLEFSTGSFVDAPNKGGLVGLNNVDFGFGTPVEGSINNSFWRSNSTGFNNTLGTQINSSQMQTLSTFTGANWNIDTQGGTGKVWRIYTGHTSPLLRSFMTYTDLGTVTATYNGTSQSNGNLLTDSFILGTAATGTNVATYSSDFYSSQLGYDLVGGGLLIHPKSVTVTAIADNKMYDGNNLATATLSSTDFISSDLPNLSFIFDSARFASQNVAYGESGIANQGVTVNGISLNGTAASNYSISSSTATTSARITPKVLNLAGTRTYNGLTIVAEGVLGIRAGQLIGTETIGLSGNGTVTSKDASTTPQSLATASYTLTNGTGLASNYTLVGGTKQLTITPAELIYVANKVTVNQGQTPPPFTGTVTGFVAGDTLENVFFEPMIEWKSTNYVDQVGEYNILGGGLISKNYTFVNAQSNDTALTVVNNGGNTPDLTGLITYMQQLNEPPNNPSVQTPPPYQQVDLEVTPSGGDEDETLYDVIQTYGCSA